MLYLECVVDSRTENDGFARLELSSTLVKGCVTLDIPRQPCTILEKDKVCFEISETQPLSPPLKGFLLNARVVKKFDDACLLSAGGLICFVRVSFPMEGDNVFLSIYPTENTPNTEEMNVDNNVENNVKKNENKKAKKVGKDVGRVMSERRQTRSAKKMET